jgi:hypothetical protein
MGAAILVTFSAGLLPSISARSDELCVTTTPIDAAVITAIFDVLLIEFSSANAANLTL